MDGAAKMVTSSVGTNLRPNITLELVLFFLKLVTLYELIYTFVKFQASCLLLFNFLCNETLLRNYVTNFRLNRLVSPSAFVLICF